MKGWGEAIDPDGDCSFGVAEGRLTITVPAPAPPSKGHGLEAEGNTLNAPRVLREIEGDFIADLRVGGTFKPTGPSANPNVFPFVGAGLLLWSDAGDYIRLERAAIDRNGRLIPYALFQERKASQLMPPVGGLQLPEGAVVLRLERRGDQISGLFSIDGADWRAFPPRTARLPAKLKLGVAAISSSRQPFVVTLENFRVLRRSKHWPSAKTTTPKSRANVDLLSRIVCAGVDGCTSTPRSARCCAVTGPCLRHHLRDDFVVRVETRRFLRAVRNPKSLPCEYFTAKAPD